VTEITDISGIALSNVGMTSIIVVAALLGGAANALRGGRGHDLITSRPYNNRYSDASGARDERAMLS
jgi:hypothetical protein